MKNLNIGDGNIGNLLWQFSLPAMIGMLVNALSHSLFGQIKQKQARKEMGE